MSGNLEPVLHTYSSSTSSSAINAPHLPLDGHQHRASCSITESMLPVCMAEWFQVKGEEGHHAITQENEPPRINEFPTRFSPTLLRLLRVSRTHTTEMVAVRRCRGGLSVDAYVSLGVCVAVGKFRFELCPRRVLPFVFCG